MESYFVIHNDHILSSGNVLKCCGQLKVYLLFNFFPGVTVFYCIKVQGSIEAGRG